MFDLIENAAWTVCCYKAMSEPIRKLAIAALSKKLEKFMGNLQIAQQKTDSTLTLPILVEFFSLLCFRLRCYVGLVLGEGYG